MKIKVADLTKPVTVKILGDEDWLAQVYSYFPSPFADRRPLITGQLTIEPSPYGVVSVSGVIDYAPYILCSRCAQPLEWPIHKDIQVSYGQSKANELQKDMELSEADMDEFWLEDGILDIEALINEEILLEIPTQTVKRKGDKRGCTACGGDLGDDLVFGTPNDAMPATNPFAVLKDLKLKE